MDFCKEIGENFQQEGEFVKVKSNQNIVFYYILNLLVISYIV